MGFTPSLLKKRMTERCSSMVHVASGASIFILLLRRRVAFLHRTATCQSLFKPSVSLLSTYKTIELCFEFLLHFYGFHLTLPRKMCVLFLPTNLPEKFLILRRTGRNVMKNVYLCSCKVPVFLVIF